MGPQVSGETPNLQPRCLSRGLGSEMQSEQLDRTQGTGQSTRVLDRWGVGAPESSQATRILSLEGRKC